MDLVQVILLALVQGITEFLPISSSAHLILPKEVLGWPDQGLGFDVAVHLGSLIAVLSYFRRDIVEITAAWFQSFGRQGATEHSRLGWFIIWGTVPAGLAGLFLHDFIETNLRSMAVIAATTIIFGLLLGWADKTGKRQLQLSDLTLPLVVIIGCCQALAMVPGTSRSGITITAALILGFQRDAAARFSFLLSIPIIALSGGYLALGLLDDSDTDWASIILGAVVAAVSAYFCIYYFLSFINRIGMMPFVVYRLILGGVLVALLAF
ncbi:undecaprenyl-diphosphate phosphatase [Exilibacterium tricleocarpae]|uniref:Undecaprenyl-diphosphatase n=1 Tax=Exilibacterium tricleocarpae TaxID=2591008 RepID=A0A545U3Q1_9GAMM|nr:undecaprenyl-diphosphate phosphatase [Exilibacterium tricleocarpae]TQV84105.1 undecaprenyl-diphosphate phosphatase [Exilibacterium tricleocarpae]